MTCVVIAPNFDKEDEFILQFQVDLLIGVICVGCPRLPIFGQLRLFLIVFCVLLIYHSVVINHFSWLAQPLDAVQGPTQKLVQFKLCRLPRFFKVLGFSYSFKGIALLPPRRRKVNPVLLLDHNGIRSVDLEILDSQINQSRRLVERP